MPKPTDSKRQHLRESRTDHPHPEKVRDPLFLTHPFFDSRDLLQVRYEMVRRVQSDHQPIARTVADFGVTRPTFFLAQRRFREGGLQALVRVKSGPKGAHKVKEEILQFVDHLWEKEGKLPYRELARRVQDHFGVSIHFTTLLRALRAREKKTVHRSGPSRKTP